METGTIINQYKIISAIGKGGMGEVFLAEDTKLKRQVALKILPPEFAEDKDRMSRFVREAQSASALNHPNIITIYEIGESEGTRFIATEFIEGETLSKHLKGADVSLKTVLDIATQIASALQTAHSAGIVHRDIKPDNVMIRQDGLAKILDFGIAKLSQPSVSANASSEDATAIKPQSTSPGMIIGTANYMSPEQAKGKEIDARSDIFSFGIVFYEMLTGRRAFEGETALESISSILKDEPKPISQILPEVPKEIERIVAKTLRKDREERYQTAKDLVVDLKDAKQSLEIQNLMERSIVPNEVANKTQVLKAKTLDEINQTTTNQTVASNPKTKYLTVGLLALLLAVGGFFGYKYLSPTKQIESIAVMPFVNESGNADVEYLSDGMTDTLISSLSQLANLSVKARSSVFRYKGKSTDSKTIGSELNVQAILNGRVMQRGDQLTLAVELVDVATENVVWSKQYNRRLADAQAVQGEIAQDVSAKLRLKMAGEGGPELKNQAVSPDAYQAYLRGRYDFAQGTEEGLKKSIEQFTRAINLEPNYAQAYAGLASSYTEISSQYLPPSEAMPKAKDAALKALALDGSLADAHRALAEIHWWSDWDFPAAEQEFKRAIELNPNLPNAFGLYATFLVRTLERFDEAISMADRALQIDPLAVNIRENAATAFYSARQYDRVIEEANKMLELDRNSLNGHRHLGGAYLFKGQNDQAIAELEKGVDRQSGFGIDRLGHAYAVVGRKNDALKSIAELQVLAERKYIPPMWFARIYVGLGDKERTFEWLEKAYAGRDDALTILKTDRLLDSLRADPRFTDLTRRVGLPE